MSSGLRQWWLRVQEGRAQSRVLVSTAELTGAPGYALLAVDFACIAIVFWVYYETLAPLFEQRDPTRWLVLALVCVTSALLILAVALRIRYTRQRLQVRYAGNALWQLRQAMQPLVSTPTLLFITSTWATYHLPWDAPASIALYVAIAVAKLATFQVANAHRRTLVRHLLAMEKNILDPGSAAAPVIRRGPMQSAPGFTPPPPPPPDDGDDNEPYRFSTLRAPQTFSTQYEPAPSLTRPPMKPVRLPKGRPKKPRYQTLDSPRDGTSMTSIDDAERSGTLIDGARGGW